MQGNRKVIKNTFHEIGARGSLVVKALGYRPEGRGFRPDEMKF
jgi:hypothetical protein